MYRKLAWAVVLAMFPAGQLSAQPPVDATAVLDAFHAAAARADEPAYFALLAPEAVFIGTDATERWGRDAFRAFAHPHFASGKAWTFVPRDRHLAFAAGGTVAWFDELLDSASYGECRGSGVLEKRDGKWLILQYHLTIPIPNDLAKDFVARIRAPGFAGQSTPYQHLLEPDQHEGPSDISADGKTLYFTRANADFTSSTVLQASWKDGGWRQDVLAPFATSSYDAGASMTPDGQLLYFTSQRPQTVFKDSWNLWVTERVGRAWGAPRLLPAPINSDKSDCCLTAKAAGVIYFASERDGAWEIFRAAGESAGVEKLPAQINNSKQGQWPSYIDARERFLIFSSIRPDGHGGDDLWITFRGKDGWSDPRNLGPLVNTSGFEDSGILSPDGRRLLWSSRTSGASEIYEIEIEKLGVPGLPP